MNNITPDQGSIEGKRKRRGGIAQPVGRSPPRMRAVASVEELEGRGVVNAAAWRGAGPADCENNVSRYTANSSLEFAHHQLSEPESSNGTHTDGRGFSDLRVLEGVEVVLDVHDRRLLDRDSEERVWLQRLSGFWFWGLVGSRWATRSSRGNAL